MSPSPESEAPNPQEAGRLLHQAEQMAAAATAGASWPYIAGLLSLGAATSLGTLTMSMTTGSRYQIATIAMLVWVVLGIFFMVAHGRVSRVGFRRRWPAYIASWTVAYAIAIAIAAGSHGTNLVGGVIGAGLILVVTVGSAAMEART